MGTAGGKRISVYVSKDLQMSVNWNTACLINILIAGVWKVYALMIYRISSSITEKNKCRERIEDIYSPALLRK